VSATAPLSVALLQINPTVGDLAGNARLIIESSKQAYTEGARLVVTPELALCGYPPEDLLMRPAFLATCDAAVQDIAQALADLPDLHLVLGHPRLGQSEALRTRSVSAPRLLNGASVLNAGQVTATYAKRELPNYQVFDERRYFVGGREVGLGAVVIDVAGWRVGLLICEDAWFDEPALSAKALGAQALVVLNASPFHAGKRAEREASMAQRARATGLPLFYAHQVGGQDEVVFDGASFAVDAQGELHARAPSFEAATLLATLRSDGSLQGPVAEPLSPEAEVWAALVCGVRDYIGKNGFPGAIIGLSGGIDSALVLAIAVDAIGADKVRTVMMPSPYTADISWIDAKDMADRLHVRHDEIAIAPEFDAFKASLAPLFVGRAEDTTEENIQARIRGELATGYCTLYGDMAGGFAVIKDLAKTLVYKLSRWRNAQAVAAGQVPPIPERIITRPPSAELRPDQTDQDSLPPYEVLDAILERYMELDQSIEDIVAAGFARADVDLVTRLIKINEYKRRQAPVGVRITHRAFGRDWRYPITSKFRA
jgi:NAD+ synthase (glutamine-hydrolysing)